ncbi:alpha/beta-hydrolase [Aaosphaeria arxii CBS 175.79]|uniref:Carboxylic ester hydrolase n=1 Tax=Aaosphaeria arxii CBS 175.79 TaxID=1450172 RepID=A0A6A5Y4S9_9PLEO|nr:alpha/beta-hydrolase [Aaosphaeria arxii CBS 175.79]KAF2020213.1 alpha/beta-hydrolase [Aaosphaeria arxii CBS 175.79]
MGNTISYATKPYDLDLGEKGTIRGLQHDEKSRRYTGIPYALPPTGEHRWRKPRALPSSWVWGGEKDEPYDATKFRAICHQNAFHVGKAEGGDGKFSEDCLFMNIWTPVGDEKTSKWPVMLWLHGGWFQMGDPSHEAGMDPTELISSGGLNAIVVAIGYRLNIFGFLAGEGVLDGNFGLWDQRMAAEWVEENINLFGGDPENITLAGRSAGAYSVEAQMLHEFRRPGPKSSLYRRVFMDSNAVPAQPKSLRDTAAQFEEVCNYFSMDKTLSGEEKLGQLRKISAQELLEAIPKLENHTFRPVTDDSFLHSGMMEYLKSKEFANEFQSRGYKILIGEVANEETLYSVYNSPTEPSIESLKLQVMNYYSPNVTERAIQRYQLPQSDKLEDWKKVFGNIISDGQVRAPSRSLVKGLSLNGVRIHDIWRYQISYRLSFIDDKVAPMSFGVAHAMDKPFWNFSISYGPTPQERQLMEDWIQILCAFVNDDGSYDFGTKSVRDMKVITPAGDIVVREDERWDELIEIGGIFSGEEGRGPG